MYDWFECKVKYAKTPEEEASGKSTQESYLVDAMSFTEAEKRIMRELAPFARGGMEIKDIKKIKFAELVESTAESDDKWYRCKVNIITLDEKTAKEKTTSIAAIVQAASVKRAVVNLEEHMKQSDYDLVAVAETAIMDVFHYEEPQD